MTKDKREGAPRKGSRRQFTKTLAAAVVAGAAVNVNAQTPPANKEPKAPPDPQPTPAQQQPPAKPSPVAAAYAEVARARFGERLSEEQFESVRRDLEGNVRAADALRAYTLQNSDEPDFVFGA
ncbi:MAG TPA: twin-arginine translocation signal domain-containing protein [Pyrinomonadaceae bacterium]|jgi:hypothetical protein|nr:twin-arginine translocation signal domain-containing protein [Pyrinomonadaceae bacterium]